MKMKKSTPQEMPKTRDPLKELYQCSNDLLVKLEERRGKMAISMYIEFRHYLNSVNDSLFRLTAATRLRQLSSAEREFTKTDSTLTDLQKALDLNVYPSSVINHSIQA
jgi:hypothetical protein